MKNKLLQEVYLNLGGGGGIQPVQAWSGAWPIRRRDGKQWSGWSWASDGDLCHQGWLVVQISPFSSPPSSSPSPRHPRTSVASSGHLYPESIQNITNQLSRQGEIVTAKPKVTEKGRSFSHTVSTKSVLYLGTYCRLVILWGIGEFNLGHELPIVDSSGESLPEVQRIFQFMELKRARLDHY